MDIVNQETYIEINIMGLIYKLEIKNTPYFLFGSTINLNNRKYGYKGPLQNNKYSNKMLQRCFNKYGWDNFIFTIVQDNISEEILEYVENIWIGANHSRIEDKKGGMNMQDATRQVVSEYVISRIKEGLRIARKNSNFNPSIGEKCRQESRKSVKGKKKSKEHVKKIVSTKIRKIKQFDLDGNFIQVWNSIAEAEKQLSIRHIGECCRKLPNSNKAGNYIWRYYEDDSLVNKYKDPCKKPIIQLSKDNIEINKFDSLVEAQKQTGISNSCILNVCKGNQVTAGKFKWKYA